MATLEVQAQSRPAMGKQVKKLRREGLLPAVVYGPSVKGVQPLTLAAKEFRRIFAQAGPSTLLALSVDGGTKRQVLIHDVQYDHLHRNLIHVDFFAPDMKVELTVNVPLAFTGESPAVDIEDGIALHPMSEVQVRALPGDIPAALQVDVSSLTEIGSQLTAGDIEMPKGVSLVTAADDLIVRINPPTVVEEPEVVETEGEEGEVDTETTAEAEATPEDDEEPKESTEG
jgi:large subunit ribosomal protein L25